MQHVRILAYLCVLREDIMNIIENAVRWYMNKARFNVLSDKVRYLKRNMADMFAAVIYSTISIICVVIDEASFVVLFLNGLCLLRIIMKNTMKSSEMTEELRKGLTTQSSMNNVIGKYHYHTKSVAQISIGLISAIIIIVMSFDTSELLTKLLTVLVIVMVCLDDVESVCINIWDAKIDPFV